jgi:hypothetical protein
VQVPKLNPPAMLTEGVSVSYMVIAALWAEVVSLLVSLITGYERGPTYSPPSG